jgi:hypothetical protein
MAKIIDVRRLVTKESSILKADMTIHRHTS